MEGRKEVLNFLMPYNGEIATKIYSYEYENGGWKKESGYEAGKFFKGFEIPVSNLKNVFEILEENQKHPVFMIHGGFIEGTDLKKLVRRKREDGKDGLAPTIKDRKIQCVCFDIDGYMLEKGECIADFVSNHLPEPFHNADYILQFSASSDLTTANDEMKCHLFFWLEEPVFNMDIRAWAKAYNKEKGWGNIIDDSVFTCTQPIYTQKRICEGAEDPIPEDQFLEYIENDGPLKWKPDNIINSGLSQPISKSTTRRGNEQYDLVSGVEKILTNENYHEELNKLALSLINRKVPPNTVQQMLEGAMNSAKRGVTDSQRLEDWQTRFDDIGRSVKSAVDIVNNPTFEEVMEWIDKTHESVVQMDFAKKVLNFDPIDLKNIIQIIDKKLHVGSRAISATIKIAKEEQAKDIAEIAKQIKTKEREARGITEIMLCNDNHGEVTNSIANLLSNSDKEPQVFMIGNTLSVIGMGQPKTVRQVIHKTALGEDYPDMPIVHNIIKPIGILRNRVEQDCIFVADNGKSMICPESILATVPRMYNIKWKPLTGLVEHPFIDNNWKLVQKNGYDEKTGLFAYLHHKLKLIKMEPKEAYDYLCNEVFDEFPFASDLDRTAAVAALMTAIQRPYISGDEGFPGFAIVSPKQSSGKTTLAQLINYSIYNRPVAATSWSDNDDELGKHMLAILREGHSCVLFDNIKKGSTIKSDELAKAMTSSTYSRRKLGENETEEVPANVLWLFTGNNIRFVGDFATRIMPIRITPDTERPENIVFKRRNIGEWVRSNRKKIISAVLSLVIVGKELQDVKFEQESRFKSWDNFVRKPLLKISNHDLLEIFQQNTFDDDETIAKSDLMKSLYNEFEENDFKTRDILDVCSGIGSDNSSFNGDGKELKHAITEAFGEKVLQSTKTMGRYLLGMKDTISGEYKFIRGKKTLGVNWKVIKRSE
ncbi:MAG: hypothetical protein GY861_24230 [bacterium]|nr:hypothetical protein [bacterium]